MGKRPKIKETIEEPIDATEELVTSVEETACACEECKCEPQESRGLAELMTMNINDMTKGEIEFLISGLKMKNEEINKIAENAFTENRKLREARAKDLREVASTLNFINSILVNATTTVTLAIKGLEREVK